MFGFIDTQLAVLLTRIVIFITCRFHNDSPFKYYVRAAKGLETVQALNYLISSHATVTSFHLREINYEKIVLLASLFAFSLGTISVVSNVGMPTTAEAQKPITLPDDWSQCVFYPYDC